MYFKDLNLHSDILEAIEKEGFSELTEIQERVLKPALEGTHIAGISQTGTGKTLAFLLPILNHLLHEGPNASAGTVALIVSPTRELCTQTAEETAKFYSKGSNPKDSKGKICALYGGEGYRRQEQELSFDPDIVTATPGRLIDYIKQGKFDCSQLKFLVLDEADRMFDMGFIRDIHFILKQMPPNVQMMIFSATLSYYVLRIASNFMKNPLEVRVEAKTIAVDRIEQKLIHLGSPEKASYLVHQLKEVKELRAIIFTNYRHKVDFLVKILNRHGVSAVGISSLLSQKNRIRILKDFKKGENSVMVATDLASRGLDVDDLTHVVNFDLPQDAESYIHRIGRTARAGKEGVSISYCSEEDYENLPRIERLLKQRIPVEKVSSSYLKLSQAAPPKQGEPSWSNNRSNNEFPQKTHSSERRPSETTPSETRPSERRRSERRPSETRRSERRPSERRPSERRPSQTRRSERRPSETRPSETRPSERRPSERRPSERRPSERRPSETRPSETRPSERRPSHSKNIRTLETSKEERTGENTNRGRKYQTREKSVRSAVPSRSLGVSSSKRGIFSKLVSAFAKSPAS